MRQSEKEFAAVFWLLGLLMGAVIGFALAHLPQFEVYAAKECVCDRTECL